MLNLSSIMSLQFLHLLFPYIRRDFEKIDETLLDPIIKVLGPIANVTVESQVSVLFFFCKRVLSFSFIFDIII